MLSEVELRNALEGPLKDLAGSYESGKIRGTHIYNDFFQEKLLKHLSQPALRQALVQKFGLNTHDTACKLALLMLLEADGGFERLKEGGFPGDIDAKRPVLFPLGAMYLNRFLGAALIRLVSDYQKLGRIPKVEELRASSDYPRFGEVIGIKYASDFPDPQSALGELMMGGADRVRALRAFWPDPKDATPEDIVAHRRQREEALATAFAKGKEYVAAALTRVRTNPAGTYNTHMKTAQDLLAGEITFPLADAIFRDWSTGKDRENIYDPLKRFLVEPPLEAPADKPQSKASKHSKGVVRTVNAGRFLNAAHPDDKLPVNVNDSGWIRTPNSPDQPTGERKYGSFYKKLPDPYRKGVRYYALLLIPKSMIDNNK